MSFADARGAQLDPNELTAPPPPLAEFLADGAVLASLQRCVAHDGRLSVDRRVHLLGVLIDMHDAVQEAGR